jgi:glucose-6-phosphate isomerase
MKEINVYCSEILNFASTAEISKIEKSIVDSYNKILLDTEYTGWVNLPSTFSHEELNKIKMCASKIRNDSDVFIVVGIGGSYLGSRAAIQLFQSSFADLSNQKPLINYAGHTLSSSYLSDLLEFIKDKEVSLNVISKSGSTIETAIAFRFLREFMEEKYGKEEARKRIYVTTDAKKGILKSLADKEGYETFVIPNNIGGRYSVLTPVGLLPMAVSGIDIDKVIHGAYDAMEKYKIPSLKENQCYQYAAARNILYKQGKKIELLVTYEPNMHFFTEWWRQLFGESEGKNKKGIFPASLNYSTDLHSLGQYVQDGERNLFETVLKIGETNSNMVLSELKEDDGLNYLAGKKVDFINDKAFLGTLLAHTDAGVPNIVITIPKMDEYYFGYLIYFFEKACAISGFLLGVNPFDQPGVEAYKNNMYALLGKPGYEKLRKYLENRLKDIK